MNVWIVVIVAIIVICIVVDILCIGVLKALAKAVFPRGVDPND